VEGEEGGGGRSTQHMKTTETSVAPKCFHVDIKSVSYQFTAYITHSDTRNTDKIH